VRGFYFLRMGFPAITVEQPFFFKGALAMLISLLFLDRLARLNSSLFGRSLTGLGVRELLFSDCWHYFFPFFQEIFFELVFFLAALEHCAFVGRQAGYDLRFSPFLRPQGLPVLQSIHPVPPF
jgi:hypothetical protein